MAHCGRVDYRNRAIATRNAATSLAERTVAERPIRCVRCGAAHRAAPDLTPDAHHVTARYRVDFINNYRFDAA